MSAFHDLILPTIDGSQLPLRQFRGRPVLIVNVASRCGLTPQYAGLQALYEELGPQGLALIGVPCNQFDGQEPASPAEIQRFCTSRYSVSFPLTAKLSVNGPARHPLYQLLVGNGPDIEWNFEKCLVDGKGRVAGRFPPATAPDDRRLRSLIETLLDGSNTQLA